MFSDAVCFWLIFFWLEGITYCGLSRTLIRNCNAKKWACWVIFFPNDWLFAWNEFFYEAIIIQMCVRLDLYKLSCAVWLGSSLRVIDHWIKHTYWYIVSVYVSTNCNFSGAISHPLNCAFNEPHGCCRWFKCVETQQYARESFAVSIPESTTADLTFCFIPTTDYFWKTNICHKNDFGSSGAYLCLHHTELKLITSWVKQSRMLIHTKIFGSQREPSMSLFAHSLLFNPLGNHLPCTINCKQLSPTSVPFGAFKQNTIIKNCLGSE